MRALMKNREIFLFGLKANKKDRTETFTEFPDHILND